jgi:hypothetical protein
MSGAGDTNGEVSRDEAAWRDLVARFELPADPSLTGAPWPAREDLTGPAEASLDPHHGGPADTVGGPVITPDQLEGQAVPPGVSPWARPGTGYTPVDRTRVIRPAGDPRAYSPPEEDDERYVPVPLPPPARLDPVSQAALVGVIGGPGYLLLSVFFLHWTISAMAAFAAVAAFIAGFVTLVVKLGDRPPRDDDDDGAVL